WRRRASSKIRGRKLRTPSVLKTTADTGKRTGSAGGFAWDGSPVTAFCSTAAGFTAVGRGACARTASRGASWGARVRIGGADDAAGGADVLLTDPATGSRPRTHSARARSRGIVEF